MQDSWLARLLDQLSDQITDTRSEIKDEILSLKESFEEHKDSTDKRISEIEFFNWKVTAVCVGAVAALEVLIKLAEIKFGKP